MKYIVFPFNGIKMALEIKNEWVLGSHYQICNCQYPSVIYYVYPMQSDERGPAGAYLKQLSGQCRDAQDKKTHTQKHT